MKPTIAIFLGLILATSFAYAQPAHPLHVFNNTDTNFTDAQGRKQGYWIEDRGRRESYYVDGQRHGLYKEYFDNGRDLSAIGEHTYGEMSGKWYFFNEIGMLDFTLEDITHGEVETTTMEGGRKFAFPYSALSTEYDKNGLPCAMGRVAFDDIIIDYYKVGPWLYLKE